MIIRSQNKKDIINFHNCKEIKSRMLYENDGTVCEISADRITLGIYADEEKAIKVLDMICEKYKEPIVRANYTNEESLIYVNSVFQMPQDSEV